jgi:hypothetical protein
VEIIFFRETFRYYNSVDTLTIYFVFMLMFWVLEFVGQMGLALSYLWLFGCWVLGSFHSLSLLMWLLRVGLSLISDWL